MAWIVVPAVVALGLLLGLIGLRVRSERLVIDLSKKLGLPRRDDTFVVAATGSVGDFTLDLRTGPVSGLWVSVGKLSKRIRILGSRADDAIPIGDPDFPDVTGDPLVALSALSASARTRFLALSAFDAHLLNGRLVCSTSMLPAGIDGVRTLVESALALARELSKHGPGPEALLENALQDPLGTVRQQNAELLVTRFPESAESAALLEAIRSESVDFDSHWRTLAMVVGAPADVSDVDFPRIASASRALRSPILVDRLLESLASADKSGERALVALVAHSPDDAPSRRALAFLGGSASIEAIEPLRRIQTFLSGPAFEHAIELIKARAEGADPGQLSIATESNEAGAVSVVTQAGALSPAGGSRRRE